MKIKYSQRVSRLPSYLFATLDAAKKRVQASGRRVFDFGVGDPDLPTFPQVVNKIRSYITDPATHQYPSYIGAIRLRDQVSLYLKERYSVDADSSNEIMTLIGSKEGIAHFPLAFVDPGDKVFIPEPGYPVYRDGTFFAGGEAVFMPLLKENGFLPDIKEQIKKAGVPRIVWINFPNNPTGVSCPVEFYTELIALAHEHGFIIASDAAYTEIYRPGTVPPLSILSFPGAKDVAIEFHSFSKMFNMTGWRIGFAAGNDQLISGLGKIKKSIDSGVFNAIQLGVADTLAQTGNELDLLRKVYFKRRSMVNAALNRFALKSIPTDTTFYMWCAIEDDLTSEQKAAELLEEHGILVSPGTGFGPSGEGYVRISLTCPQKDIEDFVNTFGG